MKLVLASKNQHKLVEMQTILGQLGLEVVLESQVGVDVDVEETGVTSTRTGSFRICRARRVISSGMVAEKSRV